MCGRVPTDPRSFSLLIPVRVSPPAPHMRESKGEEKKKKRGIHSGSGYASRAAGSAAGLLASSLPHTHVCQKPNPKSVAVQSRRQELLQLSLLTRDVISPVPESPFFFGVGG